MPAAATKSRNSWRQDVRGGRELTSSNNSSSKNSTASTDSRPKAIDRGPNIIILSAAGKPIYVRHGSDEDEWSSACGLLQGLRANVLSFDGVDSSLGDIQSIRAGKMLIVFLNTKALTLVAISDGENGSQSEGWLRLQLEYAYAQVIFTLTDQIQSIFEQSPSFDLRTMMDPNVDASLTNLLDQFDPLDADEMRQYETDGSASSYSQGAATFLTAGVECVFPLNPELRDSTSQLLINTCRGDDTLFALLVVGTRLVTIVQPSNPSSQMHTSDLHLILTFVGKQPGLLTNEVWFPICLPRFDSSGFLYAYTSCLDPVHTGLCIVLISGNNSTEQFKVFHSASDAVRTNLGLPPLSIARTSLSTSASSNDKNKTPNWGGMQDDTDSYSDGSDDDSERRGSILSRISASGNVVSTNAIATRPRLGERQLSMTNYVRPKSKAVEEIDTTRESPFITAVKIASLPRQQEDIMRQYLELASAVHFTFRCDIYVQGSSGTSTEGMLTQCFGPPLTFPFTDTRSQRRVWDIYQRLSLRLRLGSSSVETCYDALDMFQVQHDSNNIIGNISSDCPMQSLLESPPNVHGVTYLQEDNEWLYVGLNGKFFELYATLPATVKPREGTAYCARLVRKLMGDERLLFLSNPLTWNS